jgi:hypothetical protein
MHRFNTVKVFWIDVIDCACRVKMRLWALSSLALLLAFLMRCRGCWLESRHLSDPNSSSVVTPTQVMPRSFIACLIVDIMVETVESARLL